MKIVLKKKGYTISAPSSIGTVAMSEKELFQKEIEDVFSSHNIEYKFDNYGFVIDTDSFVFVYRFVYLLPEQEDFIKLKLLFGGYEISNS